MTQDSPANLLVLHAVRIGGFSDATAVAHRFTIDPVETDELLHDAEARGWVQHAAFADLRGWSLTETGRAENERLLASELAGSGGANEIREVHGLFLPLNARLQAACTNWQLRPTIGDRLEANLHDDPDWDAAVLAELDAIAHSLGPLVLRLRAILTRFRGYDERFDQALRRARAGDHRWVDGTDIDSCHRTWFELHEDLIATLGLDRSSGA